MVGFNVESWLKSKCWDLSGGSWVPSWCALTSISLLVNWISLGHVEMAEVSDSWPRDAGLSHAGSMGTPGWASARCERCRAPGSAAQPAEAPRAAVYVRLLVAFGQNTRASPALCNLLPQTQPAVACIFLLRSMLMNSWQISDSYFHSFTFTDGNILAYFKKKDIGGGHFSKIWHQNVTRFI